MEELNDKGLHLDDLQKLRVLDPEITNQVYCANFALIFSNRALTTILSRRSVIKAT
jgi:hypothetical protein